MSAFLVALSTWLHTLATVVFIGHYVFLSLVYLPVFERQVQGKALRELLESVSGRLQPFFGGSLLVFLVTGTHLMLINKDYLGFGDFFGNAWSILIVAKHVLVLAFLAIAVISERVVMGKISDTQPQALQQFRLALGVNLFLGVLILLLTTIAQAV
jgi:uncharacterized membrane protein